MSYAIEFAESVRAQLRRLSARQRSIVFDAIENRLRDEPFKETRHRKPLRPNPLAPWELRIGEIRVFYGVEASRANVVSVLAVGIKRRNRLLIAGKEVEL